MSQSLSPTVQAYSTLVPIQLRPQTAPLSSDSHGQPLTSDSSPIGITTTATECITPREQEIVCLVAFGLSNKQIAHRLEISVWTVSAHLRRVFNKLKVDTRAAVVYKCAPMIQAQSNGYPEAIAQFYR